MNVASAGVVPPLTWLYVPADRPDRVAKAIASDADVVILDLEDSVAPAHKDLARATAVEVLGAAARRARPIEVRVNDPASPWGTSDLAALSALAAQVVGGLTFTLRLPKVDEPGTVRDVAAALGGERGPRITALLESALGIERAFEIATAHPRIAAIGMGEADLVFDLGTIDDAALDWARSRVVVAARAAGFPSPAMSAWLRVDDLDGLAASCRRGRSLGFLGRTAIHPAQLPVIVAAFVPSAEEVDAARRTLDALEGAQGSGTGGAVTVDGRFVDRAHVEGARRTLALAARRP